MDNHFADAPCLYFSVSDEGNLLQVNKTVCRQLGYQEDELLGRKLDLIFTISTRIFQQTHFLPLVKMQGQAEEIYITLQTKEKEILPVLINARRTVENEKGTTVYVGIVVRNRKKFEDELVAAKKAAEAALNESTSLLQAKHELQVHAELLDQQMSLVKKHNEELTQFNHVVTHELQEPLRKLFMFTNILLEETVVESTKKTVEKIRSVSEQMRIIISGLQQYVWLIETPVKRTALYLKAVIASIAADIKKQLPGALVYLELNDDLSINADKEQIGFLLEEIMANAVKFRNREQELVIRVAATTIQLNKYRNINDRYHYTDFLKLQISDNGVGFDAAYKEQVFELYKRLHATSGYGVGLSLCKKVADNHLGSIAIDSKKMEGTTVTVLLPLSPAEIEKEAVYKLSKSNDR